jgi:PAS domain S-box-containing protein
MHRLDRGLSRSSLKGYPAAVLAVAAAVLARTALEPLLGYKAPLMVFVLAVLSTALYGGLRAGLAATGLAILAIDFFFLPPRFSFILRGPSDFASLGMFAVVGVAASILVQRLHRATRAALERQQQIDVATAAGGVGIFELRIPSGKTVPAEQIEQVFATPSGTFENELPARGERMHSGDRERVVAAMNACIQERQDGCEFEFRSVAAGGRTRWLAARARFFPEASGSPARLLGAIVDVTEIRESQERLELAAGVRTASLYARSLLEASLDPLVTISPEGKVTDVNQATELVTGVARQRLTGSSFSNYFTEPEKAEAGYQKVLAEGLVRDYPLTIRHVDGSTTDVLYNAAVYRNEAGQIEGVFAAARDVTERKRMEERLRVASLYARSLLEASLDPLVTISPEGKVTDVNQATELVTGIARERLIGSSFSDYFSEPSKAEEGYQKVLSEGQVEDYPLTIRHVSGRTTDVLYNAAVYRNEAGQVEGVFAAARDVTERKRAEAELARYRDRLEELVWQRTGELEKANAHLERASAELARSNQELEQFAYVASHDLQEPLRAVTGYLGLLERQFGGQLDDGGRHQIAGAVQGASRMHTLITDLLALSRVGTRGQAFEAADLNSVLDLALDGLRASVTETGARITRDPLPTLPVDAVQMAQLFQNLVGNAIKFRGTQAPEIHVSAEEQSDRWVLAVRDNGIGIEPQYYERIFLIFQRLHTRRLYPGTGIGLAICKKIVERHGGAIWVESEAGRGSTFSFTIPKREIQ